MKRPTDEPLTSSTRAGWSKVARWRQRLGPRGRNLMRRRKVPKPNDEFAPPYETCLKSKVSEGIKRQIKGLASRNWVKRVIKGIKPKRLPVWTRIHEYWKKPSYTGLAWSSPTYLPLIMGPSNRKQPPAPRKRKFKKLTIPFSKIPFLLFSLIL